MPDAPWFPFYIKDWFLSTAVMTDEQAGAYVRLLCYAWESEGLPAEEEAIRLIGRWKKTEWKRIWPAIRNRWELHGDRLVNPKQEHERFVMMAHREHRSDSGRKGAEKRWRGHRGTKAVPMAEPIAEPSQSQCGGSVSPLASGMAKHSSAQSQSQSQLDQDQERTALSRSGSGPAAASLTVVTFPTVGPSPSWPLTDAQVAEWAALFGGLDVAAEARKALAWVRAHPDRRKTARGMPKFLVSWLSRAVDGQAGARSANGSLPASKGQQRTARLQAAEDLVIAQLRAEAKA